MQIISGKDVTYEHIKQALQLDERYYPIGYRLTFEQCREYFDVNNEIYFMLVNGGRVLGYLNFSPVTDSAYEKLASGKDKDTCLQGEDIVPYADKGYYNGYFSSIVTDESIRGQGYADRLVEALKIKFSALAARGVKFKRIVADVLNDGGAAIVEKLGMSPLKNSKNNSVIYEIKFCE